MKKIAIIGVGGRTGTMFAFELQKSAQIFGVGRENEIEKIKKGKFFLQREKEEIKFKGELIKDIEFSSEIDPDYIFLCVKNPVGRAINYYYQKFKEKIKIPGLILSQNGISVIEEAKDELKKIFGEKFKEIPIIRVSLFNPISSQKVDDKIYISYFLPIRLAFGLASDFGKIKEIKEIFEKSEIKGEEVSPKDIKNMEFSKLFTNLIGMASATKGKTLEEGFQDEEIFREEILALKEYIKVVKKSGGKFLNFQHYPIKFFAFLINFLPISILKNFRKFFVRKILKGRGRKEKGNIDEINYYNGAVIDFGKKLKIPTLINEKILKRVKEKLS